MQIFHRRPLTFALFIFLSSSVFAYYLSREIKLIIITALSVVFCAALIISVRSRIIGFVKNSRTMLLLLLSCAAAMLALFSSYLYFNCYYASYTKLVNTQGEIKAAVSKVTYTSNYASYYEIAVGEINGKKHKTKMKLETYFPCELKENDTFIMNVTFSDMEEDINGYAEKRIFQSKGFTIMASSDTADYKITGTAKPDILTFFSRMRTAMSDRLTEAVPSDSGNLLSALALGERELLSDTTNRDFSRIGVSHMLSVSGMHLSILVGGAQYLLSLFGMHKKRRSILMLLFIVFYMGITGFAVSVCRSGVMLMMVYSGFLLGRERDGITSLFMAVTAILLISPYTVLDAGLWLSFASTLGILAVNEMLAPVTQRLKGSGTIQKISVTVLYNLLITIASVIMTLPLIWIYFGEISILSPLSNLILAPFVNILMYAAPLLLILGKTIFLSSTVSAVGNMFLLITKELSSWRNILVSLRYEFAGYLAAALAISIIIMLTVRMRRKSLFALVPLTLCIMFCGCLWAYNSVHENELCAIYVSNKKNESLAVMSNGRALMCDMSDGSYTIASKSTNAIARNAVCEIEVYMLTHYHQRHKATLTRLLQREYIRQIWLPTPQGAEDENIANDLLDIAAEYDTPAHFYVPGENSLLFYGTEITVMPRAMLSRSTHPLLSLTLAKCENRITYIGASAFDGGVSDFCSSYASQSNAIIMGAHGPVYKKPYALGSANQSNAVQKLILYASESVLSMHDSGDMSELSENENISFVKDVSYYKIVLK